jgi:hypothetical protein
MRLASTILASLASLAGSLALPGVAAAEPAVHATAAPAPAYAIGFRVGGYGFRREDAPSETNSWNECRMNGLGLFAERSLPGPLFLEAGLDTYFSAGQAQASDLPLDRQSALLSVAAGARTNLTSWLRGYVQLGVGAELARLSVPYGDQTIHANKAMPDAFFGIGGDIRIAHGTYLGANLRTHIMGNFDYDPARLQMTNAWVAAPPASDVFDASPALSAQAQFYVRREL